MPEAHKERLEALTGWAWKPHDAKWEVGYERLKKYLNSHGHCLVPSDYKDEDSFFLGNWLSLQRAAKNKMPEDRRLLLESLPGWSWEVRAERWEARYASLKRYAEANGHCNVPPEYGDEHGYKLAHWVSTQRSRNSKMAENRKVLLETLPGWSWDIRNDRWTTGYEHLNRYVSLHGHCLVPQSWIDEDGYRLGAWVSNQRLKVDTLSQDRKGRLEALSGWVWRVK